MGLKIGKSYLLFIDDYSWTSIPGDDPRITGKPDTTFLNRQEGYEMISFINFMLDKYNLKTIQYSFKIEKMIKENLPSNVRSRKNVEDWIVDNWGEY